MQSYKTFHNDTYSIAKYRFDKKLSPAFYPISPSASPFPSSPEPKTRRSIPVYLHFHIPGPDNDPSVYSQYPPLAGAVLIGAITTHRMQYPPIDRWNQNPLRCPQPPFHSYLKRYGLHTPADYTFPFILALLLTQAFLHTLVRRSSNATASSKSSLRSDGRLQAT